MTVTTDSPINTQCCTNQDSTIIKYKGISLCKKCFDHKYLFSSCDFCKKKKQELEITEKKDNGEKRYFCTLKCYKNSQKNIPIETAEKPACETVEFYIEPKEKIPNCISKFDSRHFKNPVHLDTKIARFELTKRVNPPALIFFYNEANKHIINVFSDIKGRIHPSITIGIVDTDLYSFKRYKKYIDSPSILFFYSRENFETLDTIFVMSICIDFVEDICARENLYKVYTPHEYIHELNVDSFHRKKTSKAEENLYLRGYCDTPILVFFYRNIDTHYIPIFNQLVIHIRNKDDKIPIIGILNVKDCQEIFLDKITEPRVWLYVGGKCREKFSGEITFENLVNFLK